MGDRDRDRGRIADSLDEGGGGDRGRIGGKEEEDSSAEVAAEEVGRGGADVRFVVVVGVGFLNDELRRSGELVDSIASVRLSCSSPSSKVGNGSLDEPMLVFREESVILNLRLLMGF